MPRSTTSRPTSCSPGSAPASISSSRARSGGAEVDAWTVDTTRPAVRDILRTLLDLGVDQITTNEPDVLCPIIEEIA